MGKKGEPTLTRREEQIMDIIFRLGAASVSDIMEHLPESPTSGAVRRMLNILHAKGCVRYSHDGARKVYRAKKKKDVAGVEVIKQVARTFFEGSTARTMASLLHSRDLELSPEEKKMLLELIKDAKEKGR